MRLWRITGQSGLVRLSYQIPFAHFFKEGCAAEGVRLHMCHGTSKVGCAAGCVTSASGDTKAARKSSLVGFIPDRSTLTLFSCLWHRPMRISDKGDRVGCM